MIRYSLACPNGHAFESWFKSSEGFESLRAAGMVSCPDCGSTGIVKTLMAPGVRTGRQKEAATGARAAEIARHLAESPPAAAAPPAPVRPLSEPQSRREAALAELRRRVEENSEYVGLSFAEEARAIHEGDAPERPIWGEARPDEARALIEDGIDVTPLPFRGPGGKAN